MNSKSWTVFAVIFASLSRNSGQDNGAQLERLRSSILQEHNKYRRKHNVPPLTLDSNLNRISQAYAETLANLGYLTHSHNSNYGENLYYITGHSIEEMGNPTKAWYDEVVYYPHGGDFASWGHFTQLIWKSSRQLGVGISAKSGRVFVVCNYYPPGNVEGLYDDNVPPPEGILEWERSGMEWLYGLAVAIIIIAVVCLVILIYYQKG